jgi:hypothetical protein
LKLAVDLDKFLAYTAIASSNDYNKTQPMFNKKGAPKNLIKLCRQAALQRKLHK